MLGISRRSQTAFAPARASHAAEIEEVLCDRIVRLPVGAPPATDERIAGIGAVSLVDGLGSRLDRLR